MPLTKAEKELIPSITLITGAKFVGTPFRGFLIQMPCFTVWVFQDCETHMRARSFQLKADYVWPIPELVFDRILKLRTVCERLRLLSLERKETSV